MAEVKTYRATERGYYHIPGQGYALAEEGEVFTTDSPWGDWMEEVDAAPATASDTGPDYGSMKLPDLVRLAVDRGVKVPDGGEFKGQALRKHLVAALEAAD